MTTEEGRQRTGSVTCRSNVGLKMSGCPSKIGRQGYISKRYRKQSELYEWTMCGGSTVNGIPNVEPRLKIRNNAPYLCGSSLVIDMHSSLVELVILILHSYKTSRNQ